MRAAVSGDDARGVVYLVEQGHVFPPLHNLQKVAFIGSRGHWNSFLVQQEATLAQRPVLVAVEFVSSALRGAFGVSFSGLRQHGRHDALWPHDERGAFGGSEPEFSPVKTVH